MKILFLVCYFNRPQFLKTCITSILQAHEYHQDWELFFGDDNSTIPGEPIVRSILSEYQDRITCINSGLTLEEKLQDGLLIGKYANSAIENSNAELVITLCDDDALVATYPRDISRYFEENGHVDYAYSHLAIFNPLHENIEKISLSILRNCPYNKHVTPINPSGVLDSSQVAFRRSTFQKVNYPDTTKSPDGVWAIDPDAVLFQKLYAIYGPCPFTGLISQYKGIHDYQLVWNKNLNLKAYIHNINDFGRNYGLLSAT